MKQLDMQLDTDSGRTETMPDGTKVTTFPNGMTLSVGGTPVPEKPANPYAVAAKRRADKLLAEQGIYREPKQLELPLGEPREE